MKTQFTPGPWMVQVASDETIETRIKAGTEILAHICDLGTLRIAEQEGNANLIAAAPAMYEALQVLTSEIDLSKLNVRKDFSLMNAHACAVKAILQAEGKLL